MGRGKLVLCVGLLVACGKDVNSGQSFGSDGATEGAVDDGITSTGGEDGSTSTPTGSLASGSGTTGDPSDDGGVNFDLGVMPDVAAVEPTELEPVVFAHSSNTLFRLDPDSLELEEIGPFSGCGAAVVDIAVDQFNGIFASSGGIYRVDPETAECELFVMEYFGNNLSFVPPGVLHPDREVLVSYAGTTYRSLDPETGTTQDLGSIPVSVSGDVVSIKDGPTYVSVNDLSGVNHLIRINPATGELEQDLGPIGNDGSVWGLGYWGGTVYGFSAGGNIIEITENGDDTITTSVLENSGVSYWGAGSSTFAPVIPEG